MNNNHHLNENQYFANNNINHNQHINSTSEMVPIKNSNQVFQDQLQNTNKTNNINHNNITLTDQLAQEFQKVEENDIKALQSNFFLSF